jgi:isoquinoline 1-oxidoreductase beta subunit
VSALEQGVSRRSVLGGMVGALVVFTLEAGPVSRLQQALAAAVTAPTPVTGWITVNPDNTVTVGFGGAEMGQGIMTGLAQGAAEELMVDWSQVRTQAVAPAQSYITGGSWGIRANLAKLRTAGAQAREMLRTAAANQWGIEANMCAVASGVVTNRATGATLTFADVAGAAAQLTPPVAPTLTDPSKFRIIGTTAPRIDLPGKVNGAARFGIDTRVPNMVFAAIKNCPTVGGTVSTTPATPAGCLAVVNLGTAVAVVATNTWAAIKAAANLTVSWTTPASASSLTSSTILSRAQTLMASGTPGSPTAEKIGDAVGSYTSAVTKVEATYQLPYLTHVMMEVPNCTVSLSRDATGKVTAAEVWVPTQAPAWVVATVTGLTGLTAAAVTVHPTLLGGGLGRKIEQDYVAQAVRVALAVARPVQLVWSREEDFSHDQYRPMALVRVRLGADAQRNVTAYQSRIVTPSPLYQRGWMAATGNDNVDGAAGLTYGIPNKLVEYVLHTAAVPVGFWRSVGESINCFAVESALDELALSLGTDPVALRTSLLAGNPRGAAVLNAAANDLGWATPVAGVAVTTASGTGTAQTYTTAAAHGFVVGQTVCISGLSPTGFNKAGAVVTAVPDGTHFSIAGAVTGNSTAGGAVTGVGRGLAYSEGFGSFSALALEITMPAAKTIKVTRAACAVDCGLAVNPGQVEAQLQGGIIQGISAALWGQTTFSSGRASSRNFSNTRVLALRDTPPITVRISSSGRGTLGGIGEVGVPLPAPALANAHARLTGSRVRTLPFFPGAGMGE